MEKRLLKEKENGEAMSLSVNIVKKLQGFTLDVAFTAEAGVTALLGASGSGKSMTLRCIAGVEKPDEGSIVLDGRVLYDSKQKIDLPPQERRVGYLFQRYALFYHQGLHTYHRRAYQALHLMHTQVALSFHLE